MPFFQKHINAFDNDLWNDDKKRRRLIGYVMKSNMAIGKSRDEIKNIFGQEGNYYPFDRWTYYIGKSFFGYRYLAFYFKENKVTKVRIEFKK